MDNTHPFRVNDELAFCHNGTFFSKEMERVVKGNDFSDTRQFNEFILKHMPPNWWKNQEYIELVDKFAAPSRLCFLTKDKDMLIIGEKRNGAGWENGIWYSCSVPSCHSLMSIQNWNRRRGGTSYGKKWPDENTQDAVFSYFRNCEGCTYYREVKVYKVDGVEFELCSTCANALREDSKSKVEETGDNNNLSTDPYGNMSYWGGGY